MSSDNFADIMIFRFYSLIFFPSCTKLASFPVSFKVISGSAGNEVFRSRFLGAVVQFTHILVNDEVKALASDVTITLLQAYVTQCCTCDLFKDVSL